MKTNLKTNRVLLAFLATALAFTCSCAEKPTPPPTKGKDVQTLDRTHAPVRANTADPTRTDAKIDEAARELSKVSEAVSKAEVTSDDLKKVAKQIHDEGVAPSSPAAKQLIELTTKIGNQLAGSRVMISGLEMAYRTLQEEFRTYKKEALLVETERDNLRLSLDNANEKIDAQVKKIDKANEDRLAAENGRIADRLELEAKVSQAKIDAKADIQKQKTMKEVFMWVAGGLGLIVVGLLLLIKIRFL